MGGDEDVNLHYEDTLAAGDGLVNHEAARVLVEEGPHRVQELLDWGTAFDASTANCSLRAKARTPATGSCTPTATHWPRDRRLATAACAQDSHHPSDGVDHRIDLIVAKPAPLQAESLALRCSTAKAHPLHSTRAHAAGEWRSGQVYSDTTNPLVATGDGIAMAIMPAPPSPTWSSTSSTPRRSRNPSPALPPLEASAAKARTSSTQKASAFMQRYHPLLELAPRDVVARAITMEGMNGPVYIDMRHVTKDFTRASRASRLSWRSTTSTSAAT